MGKYKEHKNNMYYIVGFLLLLLMLLMFPINMALQQKNNDYEAAHGNIVVLFKSAIQDKELMKFTSSLDVSVDVVKHIGDYALLKVEECAQFDKVLTKIKKNPMVKAAQADQSIRLSSTNEDTYSNMQWTIHNPRNFSLMTDGDETQKKSVTNVDMNMPEAWNKLAMNLSAKRSVIVAVIDTGVDYKHPDLINNMWINQREMPEDNIDNDGNGYVDDLYGWDFYNNDSTVCHYKYDKEVKAYRSNPKDCDDHGTHVAGIIGAIANYNIGIAGVASGIDINIMSLKINGGYDSTGRISSAIEAIKYADRMGADICNISWGSNENTELLKQVIKESDMLFVAAAGNTGEDNDEKPIYPASYKLENMISVAYINSKGELGKYSNYGKYSVDLAAPGEDILSTIVGSYGKMSGTSMAAPQVSGIAAILYSFHDHLYPANVKKVLLNSLKHLPELDHYTIHSGIPDGSLIVDAYDQLLQDDVEPKLDLHTIYDKSRLKILVAYQNSGGSNIRTIKWMIGKRSKKDFKKGFEGNEVEDYQVSLLKPGKYTFYASDYAGNETVMDYDVKDDLTAPEIKYYYRINNEKKYGLITVIPIDNQSGLKRLKYMKGNKNAFDFLPEGAGTPIKVVDNSYQFKVRKNGIYTIFASDYRGNLAVRKITVNFK